MSAIVLDSRGSPALEILDARGRPHLYTLAPAIALPDVWAVWLTREDGEEAYRVALALTGQWVCTCRHFEFRHPREGCKHCIAVRPVRALLERLAGNVPGRAI